MTNIVERLRDRHPDDLRQITDLQREAAAGLERLRAAAKLVVETWDAEYHPVPMQNLRRAIEGLRTVC